MGAFELSIQIPNLNEVRQGFAGFADRLRDWRPIWDRLRPIFYQWMQDEFASESVEGRPWAPLSPAYAREKAKHFAGQPILVRSGVFRGSLASGTAPGAVDQATATTLELGSSIFYGRFAQVGAQQGPTHMPARPVLARGGFARMAATELERYTVEVAWAGRHTGAGQAA